jgi:hypothetical protein
MCIGWVLSTAKGSMSDGVLRNSQQVFRSEEDPTSLVDVPDELMATNYWPSSSAAPNLPKWEDVSAHWNSVLH